MSNTASWISDELSTSYGSYKLQLNVSENTNPSGNSSTIDWVLYLVEVTRPLGPAWAIYPHISTWSVSIAGQASGPNNTTYDFRSSGDAEVLGAGTTSSISHSSNGALAINVQASFNGAQSYPLGYGDIGSQTFTLTTYPQAPTGATAPTYTTRQSGVNGVTLSTTGTVPTGAPAILGYRWQQYTGGAWVTIANASATYTWAAADANTDYIVRVIAYNSIGDGPPSPQTSVYAAPYVATTSLSGGIVGKLYTGIVIGNHVSSYALAPSATLPAGLTLSSGGVITGRPTTDGTFSVVIRATRTGVSYVDSTQTIVINAGGPFVKTSGGWTRSTLTVNTGTPAVPVWTPAYMRIWDGLQWVNTK